MFARDRDRLFLTLNHRHDKPGFHWAILLAPKDVDGSTSDERDCTRWDITNGDNGDHEWRYRERMINQYLSISLCARILLHKLDADKRNLSLEAIRTLLKPLEIRQGDETFTCRVWALNAIATLEDAGFIQLKVRQTELEARAKQFGEQCLSKIQSGELDIAAKGASAIPILDLRK